MFIIAGIMLSASCGDEMTVEDCNVLYGHTKRMEFFSGYATRAQPLKFNEYPDADPKANYLDSVLIYSTQALAKCDENKGWFINAKAAALYHKAKYTERYAFLKEQDLKWFDDPLQHLQTLLLAEAMMYAEQGDVVKRDEAVRTLIKETEQYLSKDTDGMDLWLGYFHYRNYFDSDSILLKEIDTLTVLKSEELREAYKGSILEEQFVEDMFKHVESGKHYIDHKLILDTTTSTTSGASTFEELINDQL